MGSEEAGAESLGSLVRMDPPSWCRLLLCDICHGMMAQGITVTSVDTCPPNQGVSPKRAYQPNTSVNEIILFWGLKLDMGYGKTKVWW